MANFATIENNDITGKYDLLPKSWKQVSGLNLLENDEEVLNSLGWYTIQKVEVSFNVYTHYISNYTYDFIDNKVYETPVITEYLVPIPEPEPIPEPIPEPTPEPEPEIPKTEEELFQEALSALRIERDTRLSSCDWTQLVDVQNLHDDVWKTAWADYRQSLRDLPNRCISSELNIYELIWPTEPN